MFIKGKGKGKLDFLKNKVNQEFKSLECLTVTNFITCNIEQPRSEVDNSSNLTKEEKAALQDKMEAKRPFLSLYVAQRLRLKTSFLTKKTKLKRSVISWSARLTQLPLIVTSKKLNFLMSTGCPCHRKRRPL